MANVLLRETSVRVKSCIPMIGLHTVSSTFLVKKSYSTGDLGAQTSVKYEMLSATLFTSLEYHGESITSVSIAESGFLILSTPQLSHVLARLASVSAVPR